MGKYNFAMEITPGSILEKIMSRIQPGSRVLEFGCAEGRMTAYMKNELHCHVCVIELDPDSCQVAAEWAEKHFCGNLDEDGWYQFYQNDTFDYLLFADVLEHLRYPEIVLSKARSLLTDNGEALISIPNIAHHDIVVNLINNRFEYTPIGLLDDTHIHFWGEHDLLKLADQCGYSVKILDGVCVDAYCTEQPLERSIDPRLDELLNHRPNNTVYQFFVALVKAGRPANFENRLLIPQQANRAVLYWNFGQGYSQNNLTFLPAILQADGSYHYAEVEIPDPCEVFRYDPIEGYYCFVSNLNCMIDGIACSPCRSNGIQAHSGILFLTKDPQIEYIVPKHATKVLMCATIHRFTDDESRNLEKLFGNNFVNANACESISMIDKETIDAFHNTLASMKMILENRLKEEKQRYYELLEEKNQITLRLRDVEDSRNQINQQNVMLSSSLADLRLHLREVEASKNLVEQQNLVLNSRYTDLETLAKEKEETFKTQLEETERANTQLAMESKELCRSISELNLEYSCAKDQVTILSDTCISLKAGYHSLEEAYKSLETAYNAIIDSQSYRITKPVRKILDRLKNTRGGGKIFRGIWCLKNEGFRATVNRMVSFLRRKKADVRVYVRKLNILLKKAIKSINNDGIRITYLKIKRYKKKTMQIQPQMLNTEDVTSIATIEAFIGKCREYGGQVFGEERIINERIPLVLLVSHELNLTGAPVALEHFALSIKEMGKLPVIIAPHDDVLRQRICTEGIPVLTLPEVYTSNIVPCAAHLFEFIMVCTNVGGPLISQLNGLPTPVLWWIHEARASYFPEAVAAMPETIDSNVHVYCGGGYAERLLNEYRPNYKSKQLLYYVEDYNSRLEQGKCYELLHASGKTVFAIVGMQEQRKGQDVLIEAIRMLPLERLKESYFVFIGRECYPPIKKQLLSLKGDYPENVCYIPQLGKEDLENMYRRIDCLVCASRDDPMPIVVADAMSLSKVVICSENTGYCQIVEEMGGGLLYHRDDPHELLECLMYVLEHQGELELLQKRARMTYERYFTQDKFMSNAASAIYDLKLGDHNITDFCQLFTNKEYGGVQKLFLEKKLCGFEKNGKRSILLFSHELSMTGAPVALKELACVLRNQDNNVAIISPFDGAMREEFVRDGFPVILFENVYLPDNQKEFLQFVKCFQLVICNTVVTFRAIPYLGTITTPVVWWIHDSKESYNEGGFGNIMPQEVAPNIRVLCGGDYARQQLLRYYPKYSAGVFLYGIKDSSSIEMTACSEISVREDGKFLFVCVGTLENRKGQDILCEAISLLSQQERDRCKFLFIGKCLQESIWQKISHLMEKYPNDVSYIPQVSREQCQRIYQDADCLICCSRDDPMPVVVTEMQSLSKVVICSENTGSASLMQETNGGIVYKNNSPDELVEKIRCVLSMDDAQKTLIGFNARQTYLKFFSTKIFEDNVKELVEQMCNEDVRVAHTGVSVVIPCFNAGKQGEQLIRKLSLQKGIGSLEIVCVDSGSKDGTPDSLRDSGCKVIEIPQSQFSHSYARNLGVQNSSGSVVVVMTQDALPDNEYWVAEMVRPIVTGEAVAVSCRENCPESVDLYYRVASWNNARWLGIKNDDRIGQFHPDMSPEELRINASLNDVACAFDREVFLRFGYRFGYAEDLDLGVRLIKNGLPIKILHEPTIIHGHSRSAWYYLKRGCVEARALKGIMNMPQASSSAQMVANMLLPGFIVIRNTLAEINRMNFTSPLEYARSFRIILGRQMTEKRTEFTEGWTDDAEIVEFLNTFSSNLNHVSMSNMNVVESVQYYVDTILVQYLKEIGWQMEGLSHSMCDCVYKQLALIAGCVVAELDSNDQIYGEINEYMKGV